MTDTYADYSLMTSRRAGQAWSGGTAASQWAWSPQPDGTSQISWGVPTAWPPPNFEVFKADATANWVYMLGYGTPAGDWLPQIVTAEWTGPDLAHLTPLTVDAQQRQRYAKWTIPTSRYCMVAEGTMTWQGTLIHWKHQQTWYPPASIGNAYYSPRQCVRQSEVWWDDQNTDGQMVIKQDRDAYLAKGLGMAYIIDDRLASWRADLRYSWPW